MPKFIITWNTGFGESAVVVEAGTLAEAEEYAYLEAKEEMHSQLDYNAVPYDAETAQELGAE